MSQCQFVILSRQGHTMTETRCAEPGLFCVNALGYAFLCDEHAARLGMTRAINQGYAGEEALRNMRKEKES